jgi:signal transduction histidine kinase/FixJ family two-component response regulator
MRERIEGRPYPMGSGMSASILGDLDQQPKSAAFDRSAEALRFIHTLILGPSPSRTDPRTFLAELSRAFAARAAGLGVFIEHRPIEKHRYSSPDFPPPATCWPWEADPGLLEQPWTVTDARETGSTAGTSLLVAGAERANEVRWLLWLEDSSERSWQPGERAALGLAAQVLDRVFGAPTEKEHWRRAVEQKRFQRNLEQAAAITGRVAHDFGNVVTALLGFAELALSQLAPGSPPHQHVSEIYQAAQQGAQMIRKLSLFSRRRCPNGQRLTALQMALSGEIARIQKSWQPTVLFKPDLPGQLPLVAVDGESLRAVFQQLLDNARESIQREGVVTLSARPVELSEEACLAFLGSPVPGPALEIVVSDNGSGISSEVRGRLLREVFVTTKPGRRGFGLSVVYGILQANQGGLQIEAGAQGGTTVRVVLPQADAAAPAAEPRPRAATGAGEKILVVDDDALILETIAKVLRQEGYRVTRAAGAEEALKLFHAGAEPFQLVISDLMMPTMSGFDLARRLQQTDPAVKLMFMTGHAPAKPLLEDGAFRDVTLLPKPFRAEALLKGVRGALDRGQTRGVAAPPRSKESPSQALVTCSR